MSGFAEPNPEGRDKAAAEAKLRGASVDPAIYARAAAGLRSQPGGERIDVVVLACTHFPLLRDELQVAAGPGVSLIDGAAGIARRIAFLTEGQSWPDAPHHKGFPDITLAAGTKLVQSTAWTFSKG